MQSKRIAYLYLKNKIYYKHYKLKYCLCRFSSKNEFPHQKQAINLDLNTESET